VVNIVFVFVENCSPDLKTQQLVLEIIKMSLYNFSLAFYAGLVAVILLALQKYFKIGHRPANYPPGPPTLPFIGNLHQIPQKNRHLQFEKWARQYGPVYSLILGAKVMIVLNSDLAVKDLLDKRGAIYSSRPDIYIGQNILSGGLRVLFMVCLFHLSQIFVCTGAHTTPAKSWSMDNGAQIGPSHSERDCCTNICAISRLGKQSYASWRFGKSK
jgi:Cytochrome P450